MVGDMYNRLDTIPACDGQTYCHGIVCAMHTRRAEKKPSDDMLHLFRGLAYCSQLSRATACYS